MGRQRGQGPGPRSGPSAMRANDTVKYEVRHHKITHTVSHNGSIIESAPTICQGTWNLPFVSLNPLSATLHMLGSRGAGAQALSPSVGTIAQSQTSVGDGRKGGRWIGVAVLGALIGCHGSVPVAVPSRLGVDVHQSGHPSTLPETPTLGTISLVDQ